MGAGTGARSSAQRAQGCCQGAALRHPWCETREISGFFFVSFSAQGAEESDDSPEVFMGATYSKILLHFAFSTKHREPLITLDLQPRLYDYIGGVIRGEKGSLYAIGGMPDHVHLLVRWRPDESVSELMRKLKGNSSGWVHKSFPKARGFAWQEGYGVFSVSKSQEEKVKSYIETQEEHHRQVDLKQEYLAMLEAHEVEYDPRYVWE